jgi:hypothetical protein
LANKEIVQLLDKAIKVRVDLAKRPDLAQRFLSRELPTVIFFDADGQELERTRGFLDPEMFKTEFARAHDPEANFPALARKAAENREDLVLQEGLLNAYLSRHMLDEGLALVDELATLAPVGQEGWPGEMMLWRGLLLERGKRWAEAIEILNVFLVDHPQHVLIEEGFFLKAKCAHLKGDAELAKGTLNDFLAKFPFSPRVPEAQELIDYKY